MNNEELLSAITEKFYEHFPNGWVSSNPNFGISNDAIYFEFGLISDRDELTSRIIDNDPVHHKFIIHGHSKGWESKKLFGGVYINPLPEESWLAMSHVKVPYRKTTGKSENVVKSFERYYERLANAVKENESEVYSRSKYSDKWFEVNV